MADEVTADVMIRNPKTLPADATVAEARELLARPSVQLVLLTEAARFRGAVTAIPDDAAADVPALGFSERVPPTIGPGEPAEVAFERAAANPQGRLVVVGENDDLLGLVCLDHSRTRFCGVSPQRPSAA
jgi:CBS domain-containing protein